MNAYKYDPTTHEYIGIVSAQLDPIQTRKQKKEVFLRPAHTSFVCPPEIHSGQVAIYENDQWKLVTDHRGKWAYNATHFFCISYLGELKEGDVLLTQKQIAGLQNGTLIFQNGQIIEKPAPSIQEQIAILESQITARNIRGALLGDRVAINKITEIEYLIAQLRENIPVNKEE